MLFLATFFPTSGDDDDVYLDKEVPFEAVTVRIIIIQLIWVFNVE